MDNSTISLFIRFVTSVIWALLFAGFYESVFVKNPTLWHFWDMFFRVQSMTTILNWVIVVMFRI